MVECSPRGSVTVTDRVRDLTFQEGSTLYVGQAGPEFHRAKFEVKCCSFRHAMCHFKFLTYDAIIRRHRRRNYYFRSHEMRAIAMDDRGRLSVCLLHGFTQLRCINMAEQIEVLFVVETFGDLKNITLDVGPDCLSHEFMPPSPNYFKQLLLF